MAIITDGLASRFWLCRRLLWLGLNGEKDGRRRRAAALWHNPIASHWEEKNIISLSKNFPLQCIAFSVEQHNRNDSTRWTADQLGFFLVVSLFWTHFHRLCVCV